MKRLTAILCMATLGIVVSLARAESPRELTPQLQIARNIYRNAYEILLCDPCVPQSNAVSGGPFSKSGPDEFIVREVWRVPKHLAARVTVGSTVDDGFTTFGNTKRKTPSGRVIFCVLPQREILTISIKDDYVTTLALTLDDARLLFTKPPPHP